MKITIAPSEHDFDVMAAWRIIGQMLKKPDSVIGLSTGQTTKNMHAIVSDNIPHCQLMFTGTPQSLEDRRKGLYSYAPLVSRLETSTEEDEDRVDRYQTVNRIFPLKPEDILMLLVIVKNAYDAGYGREFPVTEQDVLSFVNDYLGSTSLAKYLTARNALLRFTWIMNLMIDNPDRSFDECRRRSPVAPARETTDSGQTRIKEL